MYCKCYVRFKLNLACQLKIHERYLPLGKAEYNVGQHAACTGYTEGLGGPTIHITMKERIFIHYILLCNIIQVDKVEI